MIQEISIMIGFVGLILISGLKIMNLINRVQNPQNADGWENNYMLTFALAVVLYWFCLSGFLSIAYEESIASQNYLTVIDGNSQIVLTKPLSQYLFYQLQFDAAGAIISLIFFLTMFEYFLSLLKPIKSKGFGS